MYESVLRLIVCLIDGKYWYDEDILFNVYVYILLLMKLFIV